MEKKVIINVTSLQRNEAGKDEKITLETPGIYGEKDGMKYVSYEETKLAGMEGTTTTLEIHKDHVRLIRDGRSTASERRTTPCTRPRWARWISTS